MADRRRRDPDEDEEDRPRARRRDEDYDEDRPRRRRRDDDDEEDDRPRRRRRRDEDEEDRPRRRAPQGDGPWLIAIAAAGGCFLLAAGLAFLVFGTAGLPAGKDGPGGKMVGLAIGFLAGLILAPIGIVGVKNRRAMGKWGIEIEGSMGVATGMVQSALGGLVAGFALYGLVFTLLTGR